MKQYVQHISGQGEKWEVWKEDAGSYGVNDQKGQDTSKIYWLPKSEYRLCEPPEIWRDVTEECVVVDSSFSAGPHKTHLEDKHFVFARVDGGYRFRKVQARKFLSNGQLDPSGSDHGWAFIVEKKE